MQISIGIPGSENVQSVFFLPFHLKFHLKYLFYLRICHYPFNFGPGHFKSTHYKYPLTQNPSPCNHCLNHLSFQSRLLCHRHPLLPPLVEPPLLPMVEVPSSVSFLPLSSTWPSRSRPNTAALSFIVTLRSKP